MVVFETISFCNHGGLLLPQPPECWGYWHVSPHLAHCHNVCPFTPDLRPQLCTPNLESVFVWHPPCFSFPSQSSSDPGGMWVSLICPLLPVLAFSVGLSALPHLFLPWAVPLCLLSLSLVSMLVPCFLSVSLNIPFLSFFFYTVCLSSVSFCVFYDPYLCLFLSLPFCPLPPRPWDHAAVSLDSWDEPVTCTCGRTRGLVGGTV